MNISKSLDIINTFLLRESFSNKSCFVRLIFPLESFLDLNTHLQVTSLVPFGRIAKSQTLLCHIDFNSSFIIVIHLSSSFLKTVIGSFHCYNLAHHRIMVLPADVRFYRKGRLALSLTLSIPVK